MIKLVSVTRQTHAEKTLIFKSFELLKKISDDDTSYEIITNNTDPLSVVYNRVLDLASGNDRLIFVHDDVMIEDVCIFEKLKASFETFNIIGIAGMAGPVKMDPPVLWHLVGPAKNRRGEVSNFLMCLHDLKSLDFYTFDVYSIPRATTSFGTTCCSVSLIDGVFIGVDVGALKSKNVRFDEDNPASFHFYDLNLCVDAINNGLTIGISPIRIVHCSPGLTESSMDWLSGQDYIIKKINGYNND